jgi:microsomal dipeptidase-like Zn-dependent dipeptidase
MTRRNRRRLSLLTLAAFLLNIAPAARPAAAEPAPPPLVRGFADLHTHMFANMGFGGLAVWGKPFVPDGDMAKALPWSDFVPYADVGGVLNPNGTPAATITLNGLPPWQHVPATCPPGTGHLFEPPCFGASVHGIGGFQDFLNPAFGGSFGHGVAGYPEFDGWPRWNNFTGQQMYYEWVKRARDGGLRLMVMLAVNNETLCRQITRLSSTGCSDVASIEPQIQAAKDLEAFVDGLHGGPGEGWFRIARSGAQARAIIADGKLAVVLGIEAPSLFGCKVQGGCTEDFVRAELQRFYDLGVRHIFPVHNADSGFAGTAFFDDRLALAQRDINGRWWDVDRCPASSGIDYHLGLLDLINDVGDFPLLGPVFRTTFPDLPPRPPSGGNCNEGGLTPLGHFLINQMMDRGMLVDVDHMSRAAFTATLDIAEQRHYPGIISSHTGFVEMGKPGKGKRHEANKTADQLGRIRSVGGMASVILNQGRRDEIEQYQRPDGTVPVPFTCGKSSEAWAQAYLYAVEKMGGAPVAVGSDFNGFSGLPAPRDGLPWDACGGDHDVFDYEPPAGVEYPFTIHGTTTEMGAMQAGNRTFDYDVDGLANVGMYPDFIEDLKKIGLTDDDLAPLFGSAEAYIRIWEKAEDRTPPEISCGSADGAWHDDNVAIECTAADAVSGLADPADASFSLTTSVAAGSETASAATGTRRVCDTRGNCDLARPVTGNRIDRKDPVVTIAEPTASVLAHAGTLTLSYAATDDGSGLSSVTATLDGQSTLAGHGLASGQAIDVLSELTVGEHTLAVAATDALGHAATTSVTFRVVATAGSLRGAVTRLFDMGDIEKAGIARALIAKLDAADAARAAGDCANAAVHYQSFASLVSAQTPVHISPAASAILLADAAYLAVHCP